MTAKKARPVTDHPVSTESPTSSATGAAEPQPHAWSTLVGSLLTNVVSEATSSLKDFADSKISEHGPAYMKKASEQVAKTSDELMAWAKHHPVKTAAAVAALVAAGALLRAAMMANRASDAPRGRAGARSGK